jgi:hypothetical protein
MDPYGNQVAVNKEVVVDGKRSAGIPDGTALGCERNQPGTNTSIPTG